MEVSKRVSEKRPLKTLESNLITEEKLKKRLNSIKDPRERALITILSTTSLVPSEFKRINVRD